MPRLSEHWRSVAPELRLCFVAFRIGIWMGVNWHRLAPTCLIMTVDLEPPLSAPSDVRGGGLREDTSASSEGPITKGRASPVTANLMCSRVLGARKWSRPGRVGAGCDARVLGLHAAHVGGVQEGSAVPRSGQRWRDVGRRHLVFTRA